MIGKAWLTKASLLTVCESWQLDAFLVVSHVWDDISYGEASRLDAYQGTIHGLSSCCPLNWLLYNSSLICRHLTRILAPIVESCCDKRSQHGCKFLSLLNWTAKFDISCATGVYVPVVSYIERPTDELIVNMLKALVTIQRSVSNSWLLAKESQIACDNEVKILLSCSTRHRSLDEEILKEVIDLDQNCSEAEPLEVLFEGAECFRNVICVEHWGIVALDNYAKVWTHWSCLRANSTSSMKHDWPNLNESRYRYTPQMTTHLNLDVFVCCLYYDGNSRERSP